MKKTVIELQNIKRNFQVGDETVHALRGVSFSIQEGEFVTIMGTSGSGKSTLLNTLGCLDTPTSGEYLLDGVSVRTMSKPQRAVLRNRKIGFVFQNYNLLPKTTAVENVELPLMYNSSVSAAERRRRAIEALTAVGLADRLEHKSNQMSGGQMQRVAIARAMVKARAQAPITTTAQLARIVESVLPRKGRQHPGTRTFQALRIAVNGELDALDALLDSSVRLLGQGGRMAVITFHSLEDRRVKQFFDLRSRPEIDRPEWPAPRPNPDYCFRPLSRKPVTAGEEELSTNPRSRSAKLRGVEKII